MATFKQTKYSNSGNKFKSTKYKGYDTAAVYSWQHQNQSAYDIIKQFTDRINNGDWLSAEDRATYKTAIDDYISSGTSLRNVNKHYGGTYTAEEEKGWLDSLSSLNRGYADIDKFYGQFKDDREYNFWKTNDQKKQQFESVRNASDYAENSQNKGWNQTVDVNKVLSNAFEYGDYKEKQGLRDKYMTDDEWGIYNYYVNTGNTKMADEYLAWNDENLRLRAADKAYSKFNNTALELVFSASAGIDQFMSGLRNVGKGVWGDEPVSTPTTQYVANKLGADNTGVWKGANDLTQTVTNQLPSILMNAAAPGVGRFINSMSAGGNAYSEMINAGYSVNEARNYGIMTMASEAALSKALGGISALGGGGGNGIFQKIAAKVLPGVNNAIARTAIQLGGNMLDEALEEGTQTALEPLFKHIATAGDEELNSIDWGEVAYSALLGGLSAGLLEGVPTVADSVSITQRAQKAYGAQNPEIVAQALELNPNDKLAKVAQTRLDKGKNVSGLVLNELVRNIDTGKIKSAVENRLTELGETENVSALADALTKKTVGEKLSAKETNLIKNSKFGERISNELNRDNIQSGQYSTAWSEGIGTKVLNADVYNLRESAPTQATQTSQEAQRSSVGQTKTNGVVVDTTEGKTTVNKVNADSTVELANGKTINASDIKIADENADLVFKTATERIGHTYTNESATAMIKGFESSSVMSAPEFIKAWDEAYNLGKNNNPISQLSIMPNAQTLSEAVRTNAYNIGKTLATVNPAPQRIKGKLTIDKSVDQKTLTKEDKTSIKGLEMLSNVFGVNVEVYASPLVEGKRVGEQGSYDTKTRTLRVDLYSGNISKNLNEKLMLYTASHEITHHIKEVAPESFNKYADALVSALYEGGYNLDELVARQVDKLQSTGHAEGLTESELYDRAFEEMVADASERMLVDSDAMSRLSKELKANDKTLWDKIKSYISGVISKIKAMYKNLNPLSPEAEFIKNMQGGYEELLQIWSDAAVEASRVGEVVEDGAELGVLNSDDKRYSFRDSKNGMANDMLMPYNSELEKNIKQNGGIIVDSFNKLIEVVNLAFDEPNKKATAYFGIINPEILNKIKNSIPNLPQELNGVLFKTGKDYSVAATLDSIRHIVDEKNLNRADVIDYLDRLADTIVEFDTVTFDYYHQGASKTAGVLFKKQFNDGTLVSFDLVSHKKRSLLLQTLYLNSADYKKKKAAETLLMPKASAYTSKTQVGQPSNVSISQDFDSVNRDFSDRTPDDVSFTNRSLLADALESTAQNEAEKEKLAEYKGRIDMLNAEEKKLAQLKGELKELTFGKGAKDPAKIKALREEIVKTENRINLHDKKLLQLESTKSLKDVLEREKTKAYKRAAEKGREALHRNVEGRNKTAYTHRIVDIAKEIDTLLNKGNKKRNVKIGEQDIVRKALRLSNMYFMSDDDIIINGFETATTDAEKKAIAQYTALYEEYHKYDDSVTEHKEERKAIRHEMNEVKKQFADLLERERQSISNAKASENINALAEAYHNLQNEKESYLNLAYREEVYQYIVNLNSKLGNTTVSNMTVDQLESLYKAYAMIKHMIQDSNKMFREGRLEDAQKRYESIFTQFGNIDDRNLELPKFVAESLGKANEFGWNNLRPVDAFNRYGSESLEELYWDVVYAQDPYVRNTFAVAKDIIETRRKNGFAKWDLSETKSFKTADGYNFTPTLGERMSIYAYSKRPQAEAHMTDGGFQYADKSSYKNSKGIITTRASNKNTYRVQNKLMLEIINSLTPQQKAYVEDIQNIMATFGREKGNEVSRIIYGIDLFTEEGYFPLESSKDYMSSVTNEIGQVPTTASLLNMGITKPTVPGANNPIILRAFDDVVWEHIEKMAKYNAYAIPIENLRKALDAQTKDSSGQFISMKAYIKSKFGEEGLKYLNNYITDLNGSASISGASNPLMALFSKSKATAVAMNLSVWSQQYFSVIRATEEVNPKYFIPFMGESFKKSDMKLYEEMKKYAPVTVIKEMGGFDVGSNRTLKEFYGFEETKRTFKKTEKQVQDILGVGASVMDKLGWMTIWKAVKKEIATEGKFNIGSDEYFNACGKRFTEVITKTQVYDSVNTRSGLMRSKHDSVKYLTSFMGEPTVIVGNVFSATLNYARAIKSGDNAKINSTGKKLVRVIPSVIISIALTEICGKALVYAIRDDDEDESFVEKYMYALAQAFKDDLNIANYIPIARDIVSLIEGYDVERPDLSLIDDLISSYNKLSKNGATIEEWHDFAGSIANMFGFPLKNVVRDISALWNIVDMATDDIKPTKETTIKGVVSGWTGKNPTKSEKLYSAAINDDEGRLKHYHEGYEDDEQFNSALRSAFRENDSRVQEIAMYELLGQYNASSKLEAEIIKEGHFDKKEVIGKGIEAEVNYVKSKLKEAYEYIKKGKEDKATEIYKTLIKRGYTQEFIDKVKTKYK